MKSAEAFVEALRQGGNLQTSFSCLPLFAPRRHRVYMSFAHHGGDWCCRFHRPDLAKTPLTRRFIYHGSQGRERIIEVARRGHAFTSIELPGEFYRRIATGAGGILLHLTDEQYQALERQSPTRAAAVAFKVRKQTTVASGA